jgi:hypothetical protein
MRNRGHGALDRGCPGEGGGESGEQMTRGAVVEEGVPQALMAAEPVA